MKKRDQVRNAMLETLPAGSVCAEIGVWEGRFSEDILRITKPTELHLIDPWTYQPAFNNTGFGRKRNENEMDPKHALVQGKFKDDKRVRIHRKMSDEALETFADGYFDWVYIDGNHNYEVIANDLKLSLDKVKPNGIIAGDDYYWNKDAGAPVKTAVQEMLATLGDKAALTLKGQQYVIRLDRA